MATKKRVAAARDRDGARPAVQAARELLAEGRAHFQALRLRRHEAPHVRVEIRPSPATLFARFVHGREMVLDNLCTSKQCVKQWWCHGKWQ